MYRNIKEAVVGDISEARMEPDNRKDKYAVAVDNRKYRTTIGNLPKAKVENKQKRHTFLRSDALNICFEITGKAVNLGDKKGTRIPWKLRFRGNCKTMKVLKYIICKC